MKRDNEKWAEASDNLEGKIADLARCARLATEQLHRAVGELGFSGDKYVEVPDADDTELAIYAVQQVFERAKELKESWYRLHEEAAQPCA
jgi:hypothetical protein